VGITGIAILLEGYTMAIHSLLLAAALGSTAQASRVQLGPNDFCAGSPLTVGTMYRGKMVTNIHTVDSSQGRPVGWIYTMSAGPSLLQANHRMSTEDQRALDISTGDALSEPRSRPAQLPVDLEVEACKPSQVRMF
jgi:hypothetical protein